MYVYDRKRQTVTDIQTFQMRNFKRVRKTGNRKIIMLVSGTGKREKK